VAIRVLAASWRTSLLASFIGGKERDNGTRVADRAEGIDDRRTHVHFLGCSVEVEGRDQRLDGPGISNPAERDRRGSMRTAGSLW
jgi:hypothetical protein